MTFPPFSFCHVCLLYSQQGFPVFRHVLGTIRGLAFSIPSSFISDQFQFLGTTQIDGIYKRRYESLQAVVFANLLGGISFDVCHIL